MGTTATTEVGTTTDEGADEAAFSPEEQAAFAAGFEGKATDPADVVKTGAAPDEGDSVTTGEPAPVVSKVVELTEEKYQELLKTAKTLEELTNAVEQFKGTAFGKMGGLERTLKQLQDGQTSGQPAALTPEDLAELRESYPEMTGELEKGLTRILGKIKTGGAAPSLDAAALEPLVKPLIETAVKTAKEETKRESAMERLTERHPNWIDIVGPEGSTTDFRTWLKATKTPEERVAIMDTWNPKAAGNVIDEFLEHQKKTAVPPKKSDTEGRRSRMEQGVQPRGSAPPVPKAPTVDDAFNEGFKTGRS